MYTVSDGKVVDTLEVKWQRSKIRAKGVDTGKISASKPQNLSIGLAVFMADGEMADAGCHPSKCETSHACA